MIKKCTAEIFDAKFGSRTIDDAEFTEAEHNLRTGADGEVARNRTRSAALLIPRERAVELRGFQPEHVRINIQGEETQKWDVAHNFWDRNLEEIPLTK